MAGKQTNAQLYTFQAFDPLTGEPPDILENKAENIVYRARRLLAKRNLEQVFAIADTLSWLLSTDVAQAYQAAQLKLSMGKSEESPIAAHIDPFDEVNTLSHLMVYFSLDELNDDLPDLAWSEIFAVLALGLMDEASEWVKKYEKQYVPVDDFTRVSTLGPYLVEAMGAVSMAEYAVQLEHMHKERQKISNVRRKAALQRLKGVSALKRELIEFYHKGKFKSLAEAVRCFYAGLDNEKKRLLAPTNAERTLRQALSAHLKEIDK